jgi:hypothetical protein
MQHFCAQRWNPDSRSWTGSNQAPTGARRAAALREAFSHQGHNSFRTWMRQASESRSIKVNQGQSRWIKVKSIVFGIKRLAALPAACREEFIDDGCHGLKNTELTSAPGIENRTKSELIGANRS